VTENWNVLPRRGGKELLTQGIASLVQEMLLTEAAATHPFEQA
jgi:hypothetical protein